MKSFLLNAFLLDETHRWKTESKNLTKLSRDSRRKSQNYMEKLKAQEDQHKKCTSKDASISWRRRNCKKSYSLEFILNFSFSSIFKHNLLYPLPQNTQNIALKSFKSLSFFLLSIFWDSFPLFIIDLCFVYFFLISKSKLN